VLPNKLHIDDAIELAKTEERISKQKAKSLYEKGILDGIAAGSFEALRTIHHYLFEEIYDFAGKLRTVNISKGYFRFVPVAYLKEAITKIEAMPQSSFEEIVEKYVEMNVAHPFREGNGRSMRLWLDHLFKTQLQCVVDWSQIDKTDYLMAMERSPVKDTEIKLLLKGALTREIDNRHIFLKGIDSSYAYEGYTLYRAEDL